MAKSGRTPRTDAAAWLPPELRDDVEALATPNGDVASDQARETSEWVAEPEPDQEPPKPHSGTSNGSPTPSTEVEATGLEPAEVEATDLEPREFEATEDELADSTDEPEAWHPHTQRDRGRSLREWWLASRLRGAKEKLRAQDEVIDGLKKRVKALEAELKSTNRTLNARAAEAAKAERKQLAKTAGAERRKPAEPTPKAKPKAQAAKATATPKPTAPPKAPRKPRKGAGLDLNSATFEQLRELGLSITQSARLIAYRDTRGGFKSLDDVAAVPGFSRDTLRELSSKAQV
jgi:DNA uptake protein ComE-like DNA-binding protein